RSVLPAVVSFHRAEEVNRLVALRGRVGEVSVLVGEGAASERQRRGGVLRVAREDLDHAGERRDAVERALRTPDDLDVIDVLHRDLREGGNERASGRNAVDRDEKGTQVPDAADPDDGDPGAVVRAVTRVDAHDVL